MKISILGPTNMEKFSVLINKPLDEIKRIGEEVGKEIAKSKNSLVVVFNYSGMLKIVGDSYKKEGGKLEMLYTENDYDWETKIYMNDLREANVRIKKESWHDMLLSLVKDSDLVICAGLSSGVFAEIAYMKWNYQENKGKVKALIGIKELLRKGKFPKEFSFDMKKMITICSFKDLNKIIQRYK